MISEVTFLAALMVGFLGSTHCIGMCGGIAGTLAASSGSGTHASFLVRSAYPLLYNLGRITSYVAAGGVAATLGRAGFGLLPEMAAHRAAILVSIVFVGAVGAYLAGWWSFLPGLERLGARLWRVIEPWGRRLLPVRSARQAFCFGLVWGWLPCGLVYSALVWSAATGDPLRGAVLMLGFGLGTLPTVLLLGGAGQILQRLRSRSWIRQAAGVSLVLFAGGLFLLYQFGGHSHTAVSQPVHATPDAGAEHAQH